MFLSKFIKSIPTSTRIINKKTFFILPTTSIRNFTSKLPLSSLTSISPIDGRYEKSTYSLRPYFSEYGLIKNRVIVELYWLLNIIKLNDLNLPIKNLSKEGIDYINNMINNFSLEDANAVKNIEATTNHDVKAVEYFIKSNFFNSNVNDLKLLSEWVHFGLTSEDINNLAYGLLLKDALKEVVFPKMRALTNELVSLSHSLAHVPMLCRTHGQTASPSTVGREMAVFAHRMSQALNKAEQVKILGKCNGAVGVYNALSFSFPNVNWDATSKTFIESMGLKQNPYTTQIEPHDYLAELFAHMSHFNTISLDLSKDMWGYISLGMFSQKTNKNEVGSSTMPHKVNPIDFENAEGNLGMANALMDHFKNKLPISRFQRDLSDSTVMRSLGVSISYSMIAYASLLKGLSRVSVNEARCNKELDNAWEVLAEPVQTVMRAHGVAEPYEKLKAFTRGRVITKEAMKEFINTLNIPLESKKRLLDLSPHTYIGISEMMAKNVK